MKLATNNRKVRGYASVELENGLVIRMIQIFEDNGKESVVFPHVAFGTQSAPLLFKDRTYKDAVSAAVLAEYHRQQEAARRSARVRPGTTPE